MSLPAVIRSDSLVVRQKKELTEMFADLESRNSYAIESPNGGTMLYAAESGKDGVMGFLVRSALESSRPFKMSIRDGRGASVLELDRPWRWFLSRLDVFDGKGVAQGAIQQRWSLFAKRFSILDASGKEVAQLRGPMLRPWTFKVMAGGSEVGKISKQWGGLLREAMTDADTFGVEFGPAMTPQLRTLTLAATFLIDFCYFEDND